MKLSRLWANVLKNDGDSDDDGNDGEDGDDDGDDGDEDENIDYHRNQVLPMICTLGSKPQGKILVLHKLKCHCIGIIIFEGVLRTCIMSVLKT